MMGMAGRARAVAAVAAVVLTLASCARTSIEELGRSAIREDANEAMATFTYITTSVDPADRSELTRRLTGNLPSTYSLTWSADGVLVADLYLREHLTRSGASGPSIEPSAPASATPTSMATGR